MELLSLANRFLWSGPLLILLMGVHLYYTAHLRIPQRKILRAIRLSVSPGPDPAGGEGPISAFAALSTTLAATLGTGNIIGVSTAVFLGGPGAVFWCWLTGVLGMATAYGECYLGVLYRERNRQGQPVGGPMYVLQNGLHKKRLAAFYAACTVAAAFGVGCTTQANSLTRSTSLTFGLSPHLVGLAAAVAAGLVLIGGIRSISRVCMRIVPLLGFLYIGSCLILLFINRDCLLPALSLILKSALSPRAAAGGALGGSLLAAARYGIARGLYTNEAGIGTAAISAAASKASPRRQAYVSMTAVFWDTVVMCLLSGLVITVNLLARPESLAGVRETDLAAAAFQVLPLGGSAFLSLALAAFALTTLIGWSYLGERAVEYLFGEKLIPLYKVGYIVMIYVGAVIPMGLVWECTDLVNAVMVFPNLYALWKLRGQVRP